jgi:hypothetical protein
MVGISESMMSPRVCAAPEGALAARFLASSLNYLFQYIHTGQDAYQFSALIEDGKAFDAMFRHTRCGNAQGFVHCEW